MKPIANATQVKCSLVNVAIPLFIHGSQIRHSDNSLWYHLAVAASGLSSPEWVLASAEKGGELSLWSEMVPEASIQVVSGPTV